MQPSASVFITLFTDLSNELHSNISPCVRDTVLSFADDSQIYYYLKNISMLLHIIREVRYP